MVEHNRARLSRRRAEIARVLARNGLAWLAAGTGLGEILGRAGRALNRSEGSAATRPESVRRALEELGPTFIKLGQMMSTRPDLMPPEYIEELSKLQDNAPHVPGEEIAAAVTRELGVPPGEAFAEFSLEPLAAASIGQTHAAVLPEGTPVVVKVQRPGIEQVVEDDLALLAQAAAFLAANSSLGRQYDLRSYVAEFAMTLRAELDYEREGRNADRIRANFAQDDAVHVPAVHWEYTTRRVITMEHVEGIKIGDLDALDAAGHDRHVLAERCAHIAIVQVLDHRFFHADPHPGNFFVQADGTIALLDYGMVGELDDRLGSTLVRLGAAISAQDAERVVDEILAMGAAPGPVNLEELARDVKRLMREYSGQSLGQVSAQKVFADAAALARSHGLRLPSDLTLLARVVAMDEGLGARLDPDFRLMEFAKPYLIRFWRRSESLRSVAKRLREGATDLAVIGADLPQRFRRLMARLERGEITFTSRVELPDQIARRLEAAANRISVSILAAAAVVGMSVLVGMYGPVSHLGGYVLVGSLVLGIACCLWLMAAFWRSGR